MATLSQLLGGGNTYNKQKEIYERLGSPLGAYTGSYDQNVYLLNNQNRWNSPAPAQTAAAPASPFDSLKQQALSSQMLKEIRPFEEVSPFTDFFRENLVRQSFAQLLQPEQQRLQKIAEDQYGTQTGNLNRTFDRQVDTTNQNYANRGAFFGGVRNAGVGLVNDERNRSLGEALKQKQLEDFNRQRDYTRQLESQVQQEKAFKNQQYLDEKNRYLTNPQYR